MLNAQTIYLGSLLGIDQIALFQLDFLEEFKRALLVPMLGQFCSSQSKILYRPSRTPSFVPLRIRLLEQFTYSSLFKLNVFKKTTMLILILIVMA